MSSPPGKITFGQQLSSLAAGGFIFTETYHAPGLVLPRHAHECANFNLTISGRCRETMRGRSEECGPSSLVIKPPGEAHANGYGPSGARCLIVEVTPERLAVLAPRGGLLEAQLSVTGGPLVALARRMHAELLARDCAVELVLEGLALELMGLLARPPVKPRASVLPRWLRDARDRIHECFAEPLALSTLAESAGIAPGHFTRAFRRWFGCPPGEYVRRLRLQHATEQLSTTRRPLAEVAVSAGFYDQSHLTNAFKRHTGLTPAEYRRAVQAPPIEPGRAGGLSPRGRGIVAR